MSLDLFSPALAPAIRPEFDEEIVYCSSRYAVPDGYLTCTLDAVHDWDQVDTRHGNGAARWTDAEAVQPAAPVLVPSWECLSCGRPCAQSARRGCCSPACEAAEFPVDDREDAGVEA